MNDKKRLNSYEDLPLVLDVADIQRIKMCIRDRGRGTARSMGGNFGTDKTLYEIMVGEKDYDNAMGILTALK